MRLKNQTDTQLINVETGETFIQTISKTFSIKLTTEEFYFTFLIAIKQFANLKSLVDIKVLAALCSMAEFNTGVVFITPERKKEICTTMNLKYQSVANALTNLKKEGFITGSGGNFKINPTYFWKGDLRTRDALLKKEMEISFRIASNIDFDKEEYIEIPD